MRRLALAPPGDERQLLDLAALAHQDPFDLARPLWQCGPTGGTAFNASALPYRDSLAIGLNVDPAAVDDPPRLRACVAAGFEELLAVGG